MQTLVLLVLAGALTVVAVYAQLHISRYTVARHAAWLTRIILGATGLALGAVFVATTRLGDPLLILLAFLIAFGAVHFPAAFILFVKHARGAGKS